jgi:hypothetical protein
VEPHPLSGRKMIQTEADGPAGGARFKHDEPGGMRVEWPGADALGGINDDRGRPQPSTAVPANEPDGRTQLVQQ